MFAHGAPARLAAIVDWEMSTVGDPLLDLGVGDERLDRPGRGPHEGLRRPAPGMPSAGPRCSTTTPRCSGRPVDEIDYYVILARFKLAIVLEAGYARVVSGDADNPSMAAYEHVVLDTMAARRRAGRRPPRSGGEAGGPADTVTGSSR